MEHQIILNLLNEIIDSKFMTRKWNIVIGNSKTSCEEGNGIAYNTEVSKFSVVITTILTF